MMFRPLIQKVIPRQRAVKTSRRSKASTAIAVPTVKRRAKKSNVPIAKSLLAACAGVGTVSGVAALIENSTASSVPPFDPMGQRFSQETFGGRFARMILACDPSLLFYSRAQVLQCAQLLNSYESLGPERARELWEAKRIYESAIHPDTGEFIPRPFRMSGYVPFNGPICVAMVASQSTAPLLFWSWVNQSQNALVNFYNRNASSPMTNETLFKSYAAAVGSALTVAFGLATLIQRRYSPAQAKALLRWVAFPSAVVASSLNCYIVRSPELATGIPLVDEDGQPVLEEHTSLEAARRGVNSTTASRAILQAPVYFVPPVLLATSAIRGFLATNPAMAVPLTTYLLLVSFGVGLPATTAIFPQIAEIKVEDVEEPYQRLRDPKTGSSYEKFYYNKGL